MSYEQDKKEEMHDEDKAYILSKKFEKNYTHISVVKVNK